jgi:tetratricopeptide (TPR) repeat protein
MQQRTIRNDTPNTLEITGAEDSPIFLAPLELRRFPEEEVADFDLFEASRAGLVTEWTDPPNELVAKILSMLFVVGFFLAVACGVISGKDAPGWLAGWLPSKLAWQLIVWSTGFLVLVGAALGMTIYETKAIRLVLRFLAQMLSLVVILAIGLGLPAATVYFFGQGRALLANPSPELFARLLQVGFIATASLLPVLLFFLFDRYQLNTLRHRLYRDLFRLDRGLKKRSEIDAKYGSQILEAYGSEDEGRGRLAPGTRWPVLVCSFVVTMGWLAAFKPVGEIDALSVQRPLFPERTALTFGFLGAYFFGLQLIARRFARGDLKPKAYGYITIRILIVAVLSWVLEVFSTTSVWTVMFAFLIGILPDEFFTFIKEKFRGRSAARMVPESEKHPLTKLEGIDLYDRARLEQEGIVNVESFAHHDLIHLVLETQMPVPRLVDWMDQAILYLHIIEEPTIGQSTNEEATNEKPTDGKPKDTARQILRQYGIRTATDLLFCWDAAKARNELDEFKKLLGGISKPYRLEVIRDTLLDDEWLDRVQDWRKDAHRETLKIKASPKSFKGKVEWAIHLENKSRYQEAIKTLEEAIALGDDAGARVRLARLFASVPVISLQDKTQSRKHARRAFELGQHDLDVLRDLIEIHDRNEDTDDALSACERAIEKISNYKDDKWRKTVLKELEEQMADLKKKKAQSAQSSSLSSSSDDGHKSVVKE